MIRFFRRGEPALLSTLGPLEQQVLDTLWVIATSSRGAFARDVREAIAQPLAYTTIATTLDRLWKKNLLERFKVDVVMDRSNPIASLAPRTSA